MKKKTLAQLKKEYKKAGALAISLRDKIYYIEEVQSLPILKKKYQGKYFKYMNSWGGAACDKWPIYVRCDSVRGKTSFICSTFQKDPLGKIQITCSQEECGEYLFEKQIEHSEYYSEWDKIQKQLNGAFQ